MDRININDLSLSIPNASHEAEYCRVMDKWEAFHEKIQPPSIRRYSEKSGANVTFERWLAWCEDDRITGSMLTDNIPCTFHFLVNRENEILGGVDINHDNTFRGHIHMGIVPWHRGKGYGTFMLNLALSHCLEMELFKVQLVPRKDNLAVIKTILLNGGELLGELWDGDILCLRYEIDVPSHAGKFI